MTAASDDSPPPGASERQSVSATGTRSEPDGGNDGLPINGLDRLSRAIGNWACWLFLIAAAISCYEVVSDAFFDAPTIWVHDATIMLCSTAFLLGGAYALQQNKHIRITVAYDLLGRRSRWTADLISLLLSATYLAVLATFAGFQAAESIAIVERSGRAWDFPMPMVIRTALFAGAALLLLQALSETYKHITGPGES